MPRPPIKESAKRKPISFSLEAGSLANIKSLAKKQKTSASAIVNETFRKGKKP